MSKKYPMLPFQDRYKRAKKREKEGSDLKMETSTTACGRIMLDRAMASCSLDQTQGLMS
jgi:hypothetical protein